MNVKIPSGNIFATFAGTVTSQKYSLRKVHHILPYSRLAFGNWFTMDL